MELYGRTKNNGYIIEVYLPSLGEAEQWHVKILKKGEVVADDNVPLYHVSCLGVNRTDLEILDTRVNELMAELLGR